MLSTRTKILTASITFLAILTLVTLAAVLTAKGNDASISTGSIHATPADNPDPLTAVSDIVRVSAPYVADVDSAINYVKAVQIDEAIAFVQAVQQEEWYQAQVARQAQEDAAVAAAAERSRQAPRSDAAQSTNQTPSGSVGNASGGHSDAWWAAIAQCESGTTDTWAGYFGIIDGSAHGKSYADQLAQARGIWANYGDGAWGCSPVAYQSVPGG